MVPESTFCLLSLVLSRGIEEGAFQAGYETIEELYEKTEDIFKHPENDDVNYVPLVWKSEYEERIIFPMTYSLYNMIWVRVLLIAGFRKPVRIYALRVGTGQRLEGKVDLYPELSFLLIPFRISTGADYVSRNTYPSIM